MSTPDQARVFISYSHADERWKDLLVQHLGVLGDHVRVWDDRQIDAGDDWKAEIERELRSARVAILLVSVSFLNSEFVRRKEVPTLLRRREHEGLRVFPVILRPCAWREVDWLARMQVRPRDRQPLLRDTNEFALEAEFAKLAEEVAKLLKKAGPRSAPVAPAAEPTPPSSTPVPSPTALPQNVAHHSPEGARQVQSQAPGRSLAAAPTLAAAQTPAMPRAVTSFAAGGPARRKAGWLLAVPLVLAGVGVSVMAVRAWLAARTVAQSHDVGSTSMASHGSPTPPPSWPPLQTISFETVTLDSAGQERARRRGEARVFFEDLGGGVTLEMVMVPAGRFLMGSPGSEPGRDANEGPQHEVTVPAFAIGRFEVSQAQWRAVSAWPRQQIDLPADPAFNKGTRHPVEQVSWNEVAEFSARLRARTGRGYRLPSEAEWEYAARAGTTTPFSSGDAIAPGVPNAFGLLFMYGNVWEWVQDTWHESYASAPTDGRAWEGDGALRVLRGGSWSFNARHCRSAFRYWVAPDVRIRSIGVRVVCEVARTTPVP